VLFNMEGSLDGNNWTFVKIEVWSVGYSGLVMSGVCGSLVVCDRNVFGKVLGEKYIGDIGELT